jgi:hypothetical protein
MRPEDLTILRALYRPTTRGVRHRKVADDSLMRLAVLEKAPIKLKCKRQGYSGKICRQRNLLIVGSHPTPPALAV